MNLALIGYGKMGKMIEAVNAKLPVPHQILLRIDSTVQGSIEKLADHPVDVAIDFSTPAAVLMNAGVCLRLGIPLVIGTTGWYDKLEEVKKHCIDKNGAILYGSNFSLGVNLFFKLNEYAAKLMKNHREYDVQIEETHHSAKKDKPSGTAMTLANRLIKENDQYQDWTLEKGKKGSIKIVSNRMDDVVGTHEVIYNSAIDSIRLTHIARSREGFAAGALSAAEFIKERKGFYEFGDILDS